MHRFVLFLGLVTALSAQLSPTLPFQVVVTAGNGQTTAPNTTFFQPVSVQVLSPTGVPVAGASVGFVLPPQAPGIASGTFPGGLFSVLVTTNSLGFATSPLISTGSPTGPLPVSATLCPTASLAACGANGLPKARAGLLVGAGFSFSPPDVSPGFLSFFMVIGAPTPLGQTLTASGGSGSFTFVSDSTWLKVVQRGQQFLDVTVDPTGLTAARYEGRITLSGSTYVRVFFTIQAKPLLNSSLASMNFKYTQYATTPPIIQNFYVGSSIRNYPIGVTVAYTNPATGNWLQVASLVGMVTPINLKAVVDSRGLDPGTYLAAIQITGDASNSPFSIPVTLVVAPFVAPLRTPKITSFANAATLQDGAIAPGELVRLAGVNLACDSAPSVLVDGDAAQILSANDAEIQLVVPDSVSGKNRVPVQMMCGNSASDRFSVPVQYAAPALFMRNSAQALAFNEDESLNGNDTPAARGGVVTVYGTGFGALDVPDQNGVVGFLAPVSVLMGGEAAQLLSAARAPDMPGVVRVRVRVPWNIPAGSATDVQVQTGLETTHATVAVN